MFRCDMVDLDKHPDAKAAANKAFMVCKQNDGNPAACTEQGQGVIACVLDVHRREPYPTVLTDLAQQPT